MGFVPHILFQDICCSFAGWIEIMRFPQYRNKTAVYCLTLKTNIY